MIHNSVSICVSNKKLVIKNKNSFDLSMASLNLSGEGGEKTAI